MAALTMPGLIAKHQEKVAVTRLKKFYSAMSQAYLQAIAENGGLDGWGLVPSSQEGAVNLASAIQPYLKTAKELQAKPGKEYAYLTLQDGCL